jgi:hypothetical protein
MKRHAQPARPDELEARQRMRRAFIARDQADGEVIRRGLIYTQAGVLDMTRRHKQRQPAAEEIVIHVGGARAW